MELVKKHGIKVGIIGVVIFLIGIGIWFGIDRYRTSYQVTKINKVNYYVVEEGDKMGVMNKEGILILPIEQESIKIPNPEVPFFICYYDYDEEGNYKTKVLNEKKEEILSDISNVEPILMKGIVTNFPYEKNIVQYKENGKWGIVSLEGKKITEPIYDSIESMPYKEGNLLVSKEGKYGVITNRGYTLLKIEYDTITADNYYSTKKEYLDSGFIVGKKTEEGYRYGYYTAKGKEVLKLEYGEIYRIVDIEEDHQAYLIGMKNGRYGVSKNAKEMIRYEYQEIEYNALNHLYLVSKGSKQGVLDKKGKEIIPTSYSEIQFSGMYISCKKEENSEVEIYKPNGEKLPNEKWSSMLPTPNENYYIVSDQNQRYGVINQEQKNIIPNEYSYIGYMENNNFVVCNQEGKYGVMNEKGNSIIDINYDSIQKIKNTQMIQVVDGDNTYLYNPSFERILSVKAPTIRTEENLVKIYSGADIYYFDVSGKPLTNKEVYPNHAFYAAKKDQKYGFVDNNGKVVIDYEYEAVTELNDSGFAGIKKDGKWGIINKEGKIIVEPSYQIDDIAPDFIGIYYRVSSNYGDVYYTNEMEKIEEIEE